MSREKKNEYEIDKIITIAINHISQDTDIAMSSNKIEDVTYYKKDGWGWFIYVPCLEEIDTLAIPADLAACMRFARVNGCRWLGLDSDGLECKLPIYIWNGD